MDKQKRKTISKKNPIKCWKSTINPTIDEVFIAADTTTKDQFEELKETDSYESLNTDISGCDKEQATANETESNHSEIFKECEKSSEFIFEIDSHKDTKEKPKLKDHNEGNNPKVSLRAIPTRNRGKLKNPKKVFKSSFQFNKEMWQLVKCENMFNTLNPKYKELMLEEYLTRIS